MDLTDESSPTIFNYVFVIQNYLVMFSNLVVELGLRYQVIGFLQNLWNVSFIVRYWVAVGLNCSLVDDGVTGCGVLYNDF